MTQQRQVTRDSMQGSLIELKQLGFEPRTVIDVGACLGTFELYETFPESRLILIEPVAENAPYLAKICNYYKDATYIIAAANKKPANVTISVSPNLIHSSIISNSADVSKHLEVRNILGITLDGLCKQLQLEGPYLIKVDVDGLEVDVLAGATQILQNTEYVIVEVCLSGQMYDVINFMKSQAFVVYDIVDLGYQPSSGALWQVDMAFVKESGQFRQNKLYTATKEEEEATTAYLKSYRAKLIAHIESLSNQKQKAGNDVQDINHPKTSSEIRSIYPVGSRCRILNERWNSVGFVKGRIVEVAYLHDDGQIMVRHPEQDWLSYPFLPQELEAVNA